MHHNRCKHLATRILRSAALAVLLALSLSGCAAFSVIARVATAVDVIALIEDAFRSGTGDQDRAPDPYGGRPVDAPDPVRAPIAGTGDELVLNVEPGGGGTLAFEDGVVVTILCYVEGPSVSGPNGATTVWDRVRVPTGEVGYMSDYYLDTGSAGPVVPPCP